MNYSLLLQLTSSLIVLKTKYFPSRSLIDWFFFSILYFCHFSSQIITIFLLYAFSGLIISCVKCCHRNFSLCFVAYTLEFYFGGTNIMLAGCYLIFPMVSLVSQISLTFWLRLFINPYAQIITINNLYTLWGDTGWKRLAFPSIKLQVDRSNIHIKIVQREKVVKIMTKG